jgi:hypothetical protein
VVAIPLATADYSRSVPKEARLRLQNRFFEQNPVLTEQQTALIARPGTRRYLAVGNGPIRGIYSQPGSFEDAVFTVSDQTLYRIDKDRTITTIGTLPSTSELSAVSMAATSNIGTTPAFLFVAAGSSLMCYTDNGFSNGIISGTPANTDVVRIDTVYYSFTNGSVNAGAPAGTVGNPWLVALGGSATVAWTNFANAIGATGTAGTDYSSALTAHTTVEMMYYDPTSVGIRAVEPGVTGDSIVTTETGATIAWSGATLANGGDPMWFQVQTPDDIGIISVGYIASHVVVVPAQDQDINGRFYWIEPGETTIDPLNFATAERAPDPISGVIVFGDQFWLPGTSTTEAWYFTGNAAAPVARLQGIVFDRGAWPGTGLQVKDSMIICDTEGAVFRIGPGGIKRISPPDIEERIRSAIGQQALQEA